MLKRERLDDLLLFAEVVPTAGFAAAARSPGIQRSTESRRVAELEQRMGVRLLQRNTCCISLTTVGEQINDHVRKLADEARAAFSVAAQMNGEPRGVLRITEPATFSAAAMMLVIAGFCHLYPQVDLLIDTRNRVPDLVAEGFGLGFCAQTGPLADSRLVAGTIGGVPVIMAISPALLEQCGQLSHPDQLSGFRLFARAAQAGVKTLRFLQPKQGGMPSSTRRA